MRWSSWSSLGAAAALIGNNCVEGSLFPRAKAGDGFISIPIGTVDRPRPAQEKRDGSIVSELENMVYFYATTIAIGTPPQEVTILVDTGSSELWVNPQCDTVRSSVQVKQCEAFGQYDPSKSRTAGESSLAPQKLRYGDASDSTTHTSATLDYYVDTITFGDADITNQTFGVVSESEGIAQGIIGLAPDTELGFDSDEPYTLVLSSMAEQGVIASRVFSLDLRHADSQTGAVIYGGLDRNKFIGELETVDIIRGVDRSWRLAVTLTSLGITIDEPEEFDLDEDDTNVILDSGTTLSRLHYSTAYPVLKALNAQADADGYYYTQCSYRKTAGSVDFGFGNKIIKVPFSDFILDMGNDRFCYIGVAITTSQQILGDSVLRAGYFVFDWDNQKVHLAQAANCGDDDIVAVKSGSDAVPDVTGNCKESDATPTGTGGTPQSSNAGNLPTSAYTTTYTVTSCPLFDFGCTTGVLTTQTVGPAKNTVTVTAAPGSGGGNDDNAAVQPLAMSWILVVIGAFAIGCNLV